MPRPERPGTSACLSRGGGLHIRGWRVSGVGLMSGSPPISRSTPLHSRGTGTSLVHPRRADALQEVLPGGRRAPPASERGLVRLGGQALVQDGGVHPGPGKVRTAAQEFFFTPINMQNKK